MSHVLVNPDDFATKETRRIRAFATADAAPLAAGAGWDGHVYVWNVRTRAQVFERPTTPDSGGVSVALSPSGSECFIGSYHAWGAACYEVRSGEERWRRTDLKRFYGLATTTDGESVVAWFDGKAGLTLDAHTGESRARHVGLRAFKASRFDGTTLRLARQFELTRPDGHRWTWAPASFALLVTAFSPGLCVVSESAAGMTAVDIATGQRAWTYPPRDGTHVIQVDYTPRLANFVALEYAYTQAARDVGEMVVLLHLDDRGNVLRRLPARPWSDAVFCADGELLLNGLGELYDVTTGELEHVFEFPR